MSMIVRRPPTCWSVGILISQARQRGFGLAQLSPDGRFVAYRSYAGNIVTNDSKWPSGHLPVRPGK